MASNQNAGAAEANEAARETPRTTRRTVTVACKLPHGLCIRDHAETIVHENVMGGGSREVKVFRPIGAKIYIKGTLRRGAEIVGGYAITENVDAGVFERWLAWNAESSAVRNGMIFAHEKRDRVEGWAKELVARKSGLEPLDTQMVRRGERVVIADSRVAAAGAGQVIDGKVEPAAA